MRVIATDALEAEGFALINPQAEFVPKEGRENKSDNKQQGAGSRVIVLDDGSTISRQTLDFDEWLKKHNEIRIEDGCAADDPDEFDVHEKTFEL